MYLSTGGLQLPRLHTSSTGAGRSNLSELRADANLLSAYLSDGTSQTSLSPGASSVHSGLICFNRVLLAGLFALCACVVMIDPIQYSHTKVGCGFMSQGTCNPFQFSWANLHCHSLLAASCTLQLLCLHCKSSLGLLETLQESLR